MLLLRTVSEAQVDENLLLLSVTKTVMLGPQVSKGPFGGRSVMSHTSMSASWVQVGGISGTMSLSIVSGGSAVVASLETISGIHFAGGDCSNSKPLGA
jgi:hypothetical protein